MSDNDTINRSVLPIPDVRPFSLTTYDAKDPDTKYPPSFHLPTPTKLRRTTRLCKARFVLAR
jgi:hypothetical protein